MPLTTDDVVEIHRVYAAYSHAFDFGTLDDFASVWTADGELHTPLGVSRGHEAIRKGADWTRRNLPNLRHGTLNILIDGDGETASGACYLMVYMTSEGAISLLQSGRYHDTLRKEEGHWRFARREMTPD